MHQNVYDNNEFFYEYKKLRETDDNYNDLFEQPAMKTLLPDLTGKSVLDLGCGFGNNCMDFVSHGAGSVIGVDISENMLALAQMKNSNSKIRYIHMDMADTSRLEYKFDFVYSSLAFHYVEDFEKLMQDIYKLLNSGGELLFSQEHPIVTCSLNDSNHYNYDDCGRYESYSMSHYAKTGLRRGRWFVDNVENYHRTFSDIINGIVQAGLHIVNVTEPLPSEAALQKRGGLIKEFIKPSFLIVKAKKYE